MKKTLLLLAGVAVLLAIIIAVAGMYKFNYLASKSGYDVDGNKVASVDPKNATYNIDGELITLVDGFAEKEAAPESASKITTRYFGNEVMIDLNEDGREDTVFLLSQETGGSGNFFYVVAALNTEEGWVGSRAFLLGDRIAPQTTEISHNPNHHNVIVVNYVDREAGQAMTEDPTIGQSVWLKLDIDSMSFGTVEQNFPGEADPEIMTLDMQPWTWIKTIYNNGTELIPNRTDAFTLTFKDGGVVSITTDCNSMSGTYTVEKNTITFDEMATTLMYCEGSQEQDFAAMLRDVQSFFFTSRGELIFELASDGGATTFR